MIDQSKSLKELEEAVKKKIEDVQMRIDACFMILDGAEFSFPEKLDAMSEINTIIRNLEEISKEKK